MIYWRDTAVLPFLIFTKQTDVANIGGARGLQPPNLGPKPPLSSWVSAVSRLISLLEASGSFWRPPPSILILTRERGREGREAGGRVEEGSNAAIKKEPERPRLRDGAAGQQPG